MAIWQRNQDGFWITSYTVTIEGETFILTEAEYDAVAESAPELTNKTQSEQVEALRAMLGIG